LCKLQLNYVVSSLFVSIVITVIAFIQSSPEYSKHTITTNPSHRRFLLPAGLPHNNGTGPDLLRSFYFKFRILIFCLFRVVD